MSPLTQDPSLLVQNINRDGFAIVPDVLEEAAVEALCDKSDTAKSDGIARRGRMYAIRNLLNAVPEVLTLARSHPDRSKGHRGLSLFLVEKPRFAGHEFTHAGPAGGRLTELVRDSVLLLLPVSRAAIAEQINRLRVAKLLHGYRGAAAADSEALLDAIEAVAAYACAHRETLIELEINPLIVRPRGLGVAAVDAILRHNQHQEGGH